MKDKMKESLAEVFITLEEVTDEPGKYNWKVEVGDVFSSDELFELGIEHKFTRPTQDEEVDSIYTLTEDGVLEHKITRPNGETSVAKSTVVDDGAAIEHVEVYTKEDGSETETKQRFNKET